LKKLLNKKASDTVPAYGSGLNPSDCIEITECARNEGYRAFKLKIGFGTDIDKTNLEMMRSGMQTGERLFVDADQRWGLQGAKDQIMTLVDNGVEWFEEPMVATETQNNWGKLCGSCSISLAGGENLMSASKLLSAIDWFDFIQPDIGKWGGVDGCMAIASKVVESGKKYCPHWLSGGVGLLNSAHILAAVGGDGLLEVDTNPNPLCSLMLESIPGVKKELYLLENKSGIGISSPKKAVQGYLQSHQSFH
jgi:D-galactarolactone cycloisomerase